MTIQEIIAQIIALPRERTDYVRVRDVMAILDPLAERERQKLNETAVGRSRSSFFSSNHADRG